MKGFSLSLIGFGMEVRRSAAVIYQNLMRAALAADMYEAGAGTDTFEGRASLVAAHASIVMPPLQSLGRPGEKLSKAVNDLILDGFDAAYREKGVGDASIARKMRKLAETHYGLGKALGQAFGKDESVRLAAVRDCLQKNAVSEAGHEDKLALYLLKNREYISTISDKVLLAGNFEWKTFS